MANKDKALLDRFIASEDKTQIRVDSSPLALALGMILLEAQSTPGKVRLSFDPDLIFTQGAGMLQGGALASMADFAMGFAALAAVPSGMVAATINLDVAFLRAAPCGLYHALGEVEKLGRSVVFTCARIFDAGNKEIVLTARSTLMTRRVERL